MTSDTKDTAVGHVALALAGLVQSAALVHAIANGRPVDTVARRATLAAVMTHRAQNLTEVFPTPRDFQLGMQTLRKALSGEAITPEVARYTLQLVDLARRLRGSPQVTMQLGHMLDAVADGQPGPSELGEIYQQTISTLGKRIQVSGDPDLLRQQSVADSIRAQLLAGVRFAWLWHQLGGRRWHLILRRRPLLLALQSVMSRD